MEGDSKDGLGPKILHQPDHPIIDICFVHGLGGSRLRTWEKKGAATWPETMLYKDIPDARIITWGYKADIASFTSLSTNRVVDHAKSLSVALNHLRNTDESRKRPVIFIAHSLGGIICAQSLLQCSSLQPEDVEEFHKHVAGLVFFGTPFLGSDSAKWVTLFEKVSKFLHIGSVDKQLIEHLKKDSHDLKKLGEEFPQWLNNRQAPADKHVRVVCFFEALPMKVAGHEEYVVPKESATLPGHEAISLLADHVGMCKFDNFEDPKYKDVISVLKRWVAEIKALSEDISSKGKFQPQANVTMGENYGGSQIGQDNSSGKTSNIAQGGQWHFGNK